MWFIQGMFAPCMHAKLMAIVFVVIAARKTEMNFAVLYVFKNLPILKKGRRSML
jgi:hypothetical protein